MTEFENKTAEFNKSFDLVKAESNQADKFQIGIKRLINAIWEFIKEPITLQSVTEAGAITDVSIETPQIKANIVTVTEGLELPNNNLQDIGVVGAETITPDSTLIFTIGGIRYKIAAQIEA